MIIIYMPNLLYIMILNNTFSDFYLRNAFKSLPDEQASIHCYYNNTSH